MHNIQKTTQYKNSALILSLILVVFFLKGVLLSSTFPLFSGQDEARHYNTIQYVLQSKDFATSIRKNIENKEFFTDYNFSEEIINAGTAAGINSLRSGLHNTIEYSDSYNGKNEIEIDAKNWNPYNYITPADVVYPPQQFYHSIASIIEKALSNQSILVRFHLIRIFSVLLGTITILLSYLIARSIGFSSKHALLLTAITSFQPKFSMYFAGINYDIFLITMFALFTYGAILALKHGINWKNLLLLIASVALAILTKKTGSVLLISMIVFLTYLSYQKFQIKNKNFKYLLILLFLGVASVVFVYLEKYLPANQNSFGKILDSVGRYLSESLTMGRFGLSSRTYWGALSWTNSWVLDNVTNFIWIIQTFAVAGLGIFFFSKKTKFDFLPEKKYIVFLLGMIVALQLGIRVADWTIFAQSGSLDIGTPGRYFLPNLVSHIILVFTGIGALLAHIGRLISTNKNLDSRLRGNDSSEKYFNYSLILGLILMFAFSMYLIFNVIILRFYL